MGGTATPKIGVEGVLAGVAAGAIKIAENKGNENCTRQWRRPLGRKLNLKVMRHRDIDVHRPRK
jgi:hypothetical protein